MGKTEFTPAPAKQTGQGNFPDLILVLGAPYLNHITFVFSIITLTLLSSSPSFHFLKAHSQVWDNFLQLDAL